MLQLRKNKKGFTLVELIVVIAIMAVLAGTVAGVTVSQLNKQTNNTAKSEAKSLASDLHNFMIDYRLPKEMNGQTVKWEEGAAIDSAEKLAYAVNAFVTENNQGTNIKVVSLGEEPATPPEKNDNITSTTYVENYIAGGHKFYAVVYVVTKKAEGVTPVLKVRFCCKQKGNGNNQFPFADYTYSDVLADGN